MRQFGEISKPPNGSYWPLADHREHNLTSKFAIGSHPFVQRSDTYRPTRGAISSLSFYKVSHTMKSINLGGHEVVVADLLAEQNMQVLLLELQIAGLQEYLDTRRELIRWLESIQAES
jgi:hypothetical protein